MTAGGESARKRAGDQPDTGRRLAEFVYRLVTEGQTPAQQAIAVGIGIFIGCIPLFGIHLPLVLVIATLSRLSRLRMFAATCISNPIMAPILVWSEVQIGTRLLTGAWLEHSIDAVWSAGVYTLGLSLALGAVVTGVVLGLSAAFTIWFWMPKGDDEKRRRRVIEDAAYRYLDYGLRVWFRTRLLFFRNRPLVELVISGRLDPGRNLADVWCGAGEFLTLLLSGSPHAFPESCVGFTSDDSHAAIARTVLPTSVTVEVHGSATALPGNLDTVIAWEKSGNGSSKLTDHLLGRVHRSLRQSGSFVVLWSARRGDDSATRVVKRLEKKGFQIQQHTELSRFFVNRHLLMVTT